MRFLAALVLGLLLFSGHSAADTILCNAAREGTIIYNTDHKLVQFCNGAQWIGLAAKIGGAGDTLSDLSCTAGQVPEWNGTNWTCGTGMSGAGADTLAGLNCSTGEIPQWDGGEWGCAEGGEGLWTDSGNYLSYDGEKGVKLTPIGGLPQPSLVIGDFGCANNEILKWNGSTWICAADEAGMSGLPPLSPANIWVGSASNAATAVSLSGDATLSNTGALTIANNAITAAKTNFVGILTEGKWCTVSSGKIVCSSDAPGGGGGSTYQSFTSSGTWNKPASGTVALVECWGGGGGGGKHTATGAGGGGGGYLSRHIPMAMLPASVTVTIGAGGAGATVNNGTGGAGGATSFGTFVTAYGGGGGDYLNGGSGGGSLGQGGNGDGGSTTPKVPGQPLRVSSILVFSGVYKPAYEGQGGHMNTSPDTPPQPSYMHGGGGGGRSTNAALNTGANSVFGGAGGGGGGGSQGPGGTSLYGGNGGDATTTTGGDGSQPGGGGGGGRSGNGGNGGDGQCNVTVF